MCGRFQISRVSAFLGVVVLSACAGAIEREPRSSRIYPGPYDRIAQCVYTKLEAADSAISVKLTDLNTMNEMRISGDIPGALNVYHIRFLKAEGDQTSIVVRTFPSLNNQFEDMTGQAIDACTKP